MQCVGARRVPHQPINNCTCIFHPHRYIICKFLTAPICLQGCQNNTLDQLHVFDLGAGGVRIGRGRCNDMLHNGALLAVGFFVDCSLRHLTYTEEASDADQGNIALGVIRHTPESRGIALIIVLSSM